MWLTVTIVVGWVLVGLAVALFMIRRGHSAGTWLALGVSGGPFSLFLVVLAVQREGEVTLQSTLEQGQTRSGALRVLVGVDGSAAAEAAAAAAVTLLGPSLGRLDLATVLDFDTVIDPIASDPDRRVSVVQAGARARLQELGVSPTCVRLTGRPAVEIAQAAAGGAYDLVVVGPHGRRAAASLGSVARALTEHAPVPVLVVRGSAVPASGAPSAAGQRSA